MTLTKKRTPTKTINAYTLPPRFYFTAYGQNAKQGAFDLLDLLRLTSMIKLTKQERAEYKDLTELLKIMRCFYYADYRLSYKRESNKRVLFYYLSVYNYKLLFKGNIAIKIYTTTYKRYNTYEKIKSYLLETSTYFKVDNMYKLFNIDYITTNKDLARTISI